jgi:uncharacterized linocin/CFP29 family protein
MIQSNDDTGSYLTKEEVQLIQQVTERAPDRDLTFNQVFAIESIPNPDAEEHGYFIAEDDEGEAKLVQKLESYPMLSVSNRRVTYPIYKAKLGFVIPEEDIAASRSFGKPLNTEYVERVTRAINVKLNKLAYIGDSQFGVPGVLEASGVTAITGTSWAVTTKDLANEVITYVNALPAIYRMGNYRLVLADKEWKRLNSYFNSSAAVGGQSHLERIRSALPNLTIVPPEINLDSGTVLSDGTTTVADGTALLIPADRKLCRMTLAKAPYARTENNIVDEAVKGAVAARAGIVETPFPTAIGKITGLA